MFAHAGADGKRTHASLIRSINRMLSRLSILVLGAWVIAQAPPAAGACAEVCVDAVETDRGVELYVVNGHPYPVTASLYARTRNLRVNGGNPVTVTLGGNSRERALRFDRPDPRGDYDYRYWYDWTFGRRDAVHDDGVLYHLPYPPGSRYRVLQGFSGRLSHRGRETYAVDFDLPVGTPVHAARGGIVVDVEQSHDEGGWEDRYYRTANFIVILHDDGTTGEYYHLDHKGAAVNAGDRVSAGDHIGWSGNTGHTTRPHLHFAVYRADTWGRTQSVPFRFITEEGVVDFPRQWRRYGTARE